MKKKVLFIIMLLVALVTLTGCNNKKEEKNEDAIKFKEEYESINGTQTSTGKDYRNVSIDEDNPIVYATPEEIINKIENNETFYFYVGSKLCPWCRSVIETMIKSAKANNIKTIYYIEAWDDNKKEILRDKYEIGTDGQTIKTVDGTEEYYRLLDILNDYLDDYTYSANKNGGTKLDVNEKRIYFPSVFYIKDGKAAAFTSGISDLQTLSNDELTEEILNDELNKFNDIFTK